jgi:hypothetical protein
MVPQTSQPSNNGYRKIIAGGAFLLVAFFIIPILVSNLGLFDKTQYIFQENPWISLFVYWIISVFAKVTIVTEGFLGTFGFFSIANKTLGYWPSMFFGMTTIVPAVTILCWWLGKHAKRIPKINHLRKTVLRKYTFIGKSTLERNFLLTVIFIFSIHYNVISYLAGFSDVRLSWLLKATFCGQFLRYLIYLYRDTLYGKVGLTQFEFTAYWGINIMAYLLPGFCITFIIYLSSPELRHLKLKELPLGIVSKLKNKNS